MGAPKSAGGKFKLGMEPVTKMAPAKKVPHPVSKKMTRLDVPDPVEKKATTRFAGFTTDGEFLSYGSDRRRIKGARATVEAGAAARSRMTATRVIGGAAILGPLGAILGGLAKKDESKVFLIVEMQDGTVFTEEVKGRHEGAARQFAGLINTQAR